MAQVVYQPWALSGLTHIFGSNTFAAETPAAFSISYFDRWIRGIVSLSQPFTQELPHAIRDIITADPTSSIAVKYRNYVKTVLLPLCRRVTGILRAHSAVIEVCCHSRIGICRSMPAAVVSSHHHCSDYTVLQWPSIEWLAEKVRHRPSPLSLQIDLGPQPYIMCCSADPMLQLLDANAS